MTTPKPDPAEAAAIKCCEVCEGWGLYYSRGYPANLIRSFAQIFRQAYAAQSAELERLRSFTSMFPKCWRLDQTGRLTQDMPMVPGMEYYLLYRSPTGLVIVAHVWQWDEEHPDHWVGFYESKAAAEAAKQKQEKNNEEQN